MCGRYTLATPGEEIAATFGLTESLELEPRFNIAPTQPAPVVRVEDGARAALMCRWGLVPFWAEDPAIGSRLINARAETVADKPAYRDSFEHRRCLVVADGFYEWRRRGGRSQPFLFSRPSGAPFAMAGLWDRWQRGERRLETYTVVTTDANREVGAVHDRMPLVLSARDWPIWLDPDNPGDAKVRTLLRPAPDGSLAGRPVSPLVDNPANDSPRCIEAVSLDDGDAVDQGRLF